jgi:hypothetical protein
MKIKAWRGAEVAEEDGKEIKVWGRSKVTNGTGIGSEELKY